MFVYLFENQKYGRKAELANYIFDAFAHTPDRSI
jgi:hypothetical protein